MNKMKVKLTNEETFQTQALEISEPDDNFDPTIPPETGEEYLMHMLYERQRCPAIVTKQLPDDTENNVESRRIEIIQNPPLPVHNSVIPTPEWQRLQAEDFKQTRERVILMRRELSNECYDQSLEPPLTSEVSEWLAFCQQEQPLLSTLLRLSQTDLELLLQMISTWLQNEQKTEPEPSTSTTSTATTNIDLSNGEVWLGRWLYATLVCLHLPLEPDVFSNLRCIARTCIELRNKLDPNEVERAAPYNLIITIITLVFKQADFAAYLQKTL